MGAGRGLVPYCACPELHFIEKVSVLITSPVRQKWSMVPPTKLIETEVATRATKPTMALNSRLSR